MEIIIEPHTLDRALERGASKEEIIDTLSSGTPIEAKKNRKAKTKTFEYNKERNGKHYPHKKLEVYYIIENNKIITVTVYTFYGKF